ncbi:MAG: type II CAAX endopeptidase family protein [Bacteroidota bacterium]
MNYFSSISISVVTLSFIVYYFIVYAEKTMDFFIKNNGKEKAKITAIIFQRLAGVFFFGIVPLIFIVAMNQRFTDVGLSFESKSPMWGWILGLGAVCFIINYFSAKKDDHLAVYPQIRTPQPWSRTLLIISSLTLTLYTLAYEMMFRGYLLFSCEKELGMWLAIIINTVIYTLVHLPKGWKETVGSIPMGIVLCWLTLKSGNIWAAFFIHISLVLSSEWFSIREHQNRAAVKGT